MEEEVKKTVEHLKAGKVVLYPTDTIWGLGCDATNEEAVKKIYSVKERAESKALIILIGEIHQLYYYAEEVPEIAWDIVEFSEKPLTIIYPKGKNLAPSLMNEDGSIAIRLVQDEFCQRVIKKLGKALVSTSANISTQPSPQNFSEISQEVIDRVDYVVDHRRNETAKATPSTIMKLGLNGEVSFIRK
ncbi:L-threonylcarbamoyladenylate synthase [Cytophagaceae bacterium ABcell3]|nr:L-threonylcarbamoyladenylate synthase [Cytophagaceae bacterium ABcell3]